jgi:hypothetical protein
VESAEFERGDGEPDETSKWNCSSGASHSDIHGQAHAATVGSREPVSFCVRHAETATLWFIHASFPIPTRFTLISSFDLPPVGSLEKEKAQAQFG